LENLTKAAWVVIALVHVLPSMVFFRPALAERLYGVSPSGEIGILLVHRGALFLAITVACIFAAMDESVRRAISCIAAISVIGFLIVYVNSGMPAGSLRTIALADAFLLLPLAFVTFRAWISAA
jgi:hypothetical protein